MSPAVVRKPPPPEQLDIIETKLEDSDNLTDKNLSVPLPSSPLTANILDSLNGASVVDGGVRGNSVPMNSTTEQLKQVIEAAKHTIRSQMSQIASSVVGTQQTPLLPVLPTISGRLTQTFDYGNQTNKELEQVAAQQREDAAYIERERWRGNL